MSGMRHPSMSTPPLNQNELVSGVCLSKTVGERKNEVRICGSLFRDPICHTTTTIWNRGSKTQGSQRGCRAGICVQ